MIKVILPDRILGIGFRYMLTAAEDLSGKVRATICLLYEVAAWPDGTRPRPTDIKLLNFGRAKCSPLDQFNKARGRKIALTRVLKKCNVWMGKKDRQVVWEAYLNRDKGGS